MPTFSRRATIAIACAVILLIISMGIRATTGLFMQPMTAAHGWLRADFAMAFAIQNLVWGLSNPLLGMVADRFGSARAIVFGAICYIAGLVLMRYVDTPGGLILTNGVLIGIGLSGTTFSILLGVVTRIVPAEKRSLALGITAAGGSFGQFVMLPVGQELIGSFEWYGALITLALIAGIMVPLTAGLMSRGGTPGVVDQQSMGQAIREATRHRSFHYIFLGYFTCGFHTAFITLHFPAYIVDLGMPVSVGVAGIALVGLFNVIGTYTAGVLGGKHSKKNLLGYLYFGRAIVILAFFLAPKTPATVYLFCGTIGLLWLGTIPLTNGLIGQIYGIRYVSTLTGIVFFGHQIGGFLGAWLGGYVFDRYQSYDLVWILSIVVGVTAALFSWPVDERPIVRAPASTVVLA